MAVIIFRMAVFPLRMGGRIRNGFYRGIRFQYPNHNHDFPPVCKDFIKMDGETALRMDVLQGVA
jgi:hypothetical protein